MPELRKDPIIGRWVIVSTERARRPSDFKEAHSAELPTMSICPFCEGNEDKTPPEVMSYRKPGTIKDKPGWILRVVPNKFPALSIEGDLNRTGIGIFDMMNGIGAHEVIIETTNHNTHLADQDEPQIEEVLRAFRDRILDLEKDKRFRYVLVFKNYGVTAGTSLAHPHCQLIATPIMPKFVKEELVGAREYFKDKERCVFCDLIKQEISIGERIVLENEDFILIAPFASRFPFELHLLPRHHNYAYCEMTNGEIVNFAKILKETLLRLKKTLNDPPYNFVLHTAPNIIPRPGHPEYWGSIQYDFHWHLEIIPRVTRIAGFEWGTGFYINPTPPEEAAKYMREL